MVFEGGGVNLLLLVVKPEYQGNFWALRRFINTFAEVAFDCGANRIFGIASANDCPLRGRDWRELPAKDGNGTKLLRLYKMLGFEIHPGTQTFDLKAPPTL